MSSLPPMDRRPEGGTRRRRRGFGLTWWGEAWVTALEQRARLDPNRLPRGRSYARGGTVGELTIAPGEVRATVQGRRVRPYQVRVRVRVLEAEEWDRVLDAIAAQIGHAAALLDGELLPEVADDVRSAGTDLLPGPGDLQPLLLPRLGRPVQACRGGLLPGGRCAGRRPVLAVAAAWPPARRGAGRAARPAPLRRGGHGPPDRSSLATDPGVDARGLPALAGSAAAPSPPQRPGHPAVLPVDPPPALTCGPRTWWRWPPTPPRVPSSWRPGPVTVACRSTLPTWLAAPPGCWKPEAASPGWPPQPAWPRGSCCAGRSPGSRPATAGWTRLDDLAALGHRPRRGAGRDGPARRPRCRARLAQPPDFAARPAAAGRRWAVVPVRPLRRRVGPGRPTLPGAGCAGRGGRRRPSATSRAVRWRRTRS